MVAALPPAHLGGVYIYNNIYAAEMGGGGSISADRWTSKWTGSYLGYGYLDSGYLNCNLFERQMTISFDD